jgi:hypothetical protein
MHRARFARVRFVHLPTPLEPMPNLARLPGGPQLYLKRDHGTGLPTCGEKTWKKLWLLIGDAFAHRADSVITLPPEREAASSIADGCILQDGPQPLRCDDDSSLQDRSSPRRRLATNCARGARADLPSVRPHDRILEDGRPKERLRRTCK